MVGWRLVMISDGAEHLSQNDSVAHAVSLCVCRKTLPRQRSIPNTTWFLDRYLAAVVVQPWWRVGRERGHEIFEGVATEFAAGADDAGQRLLGHHAAVAAVAAGEFAGNHVEAGFEFAFAVGGGDVVGIAEEGEDFTHVFAEELGEAFVVRIVFCGEHEVAQLLRERQGLLADLFESGLFGEVVVTKSEAFLQQIFDGLRETSRAADRDF